MGRVLGFGLACSLALVITSGTQAGNLDPPSAPAATMATLDEISLSAAEGRTPILPAAAASPGLLIDQPGSYVLTGDVTMLNANANCIEITADDVQIDLNGHTLAGQASGSSWGIRQTAGSRVTVFNGTIRHFGVEAIELRAVAHVYDVRVSFNGRGGVDVGAGSICERIIGNANGTFLSPDAVIRTGRESIVKNCVITGTTGPGSAIQAGLSNEVTGCHLGNHQGVGVDAGATSRVSGCTADNVDGTAFRLAEGCLISDCVAWGGQSDGIEAGDACSITGNVLRFFQGSAISLTGDRSRVTGNLCENSTAGIVANGSSFNQIADNTVINDGNEVGLGTTGGATRNLIVRNMLSGVTISAEVGNTVGPLVVGTNVLTSDLPWANLEH